MTNTAEKTIPFGAAHTYIADIREYPPPHPPREHQLIMSGYNDPLKLKTWKVLEIVLS